MDTIFHYLFPLIEKMFVGFGAYTILYIILINFLKKPRLQTLDNSACKLIHRMGLIYLIAFILQVLLIFQYPEENEILYSRMTGNYWFAYWLRPAAWITITQLFRIKKIRHSKWIRLLLAIPFTISFEKYVILVTSLHRDYLPNAEPLFLNWLLSIPGSLFMFLIFTGLNYLGDRIPSPKSTEKTN